MIYYNYTGLENVIISQHGARKCRFIEDMIELKHCLNTILDKLQPVLIYKKPTSSFNVKIVAKPYVSIRYDRVVSCLYLNINPDTKEVSCECHRIRSDKQCYETITIMYTVEQKYSDVVVGKYVTNVELFNFILMGDKENVTESKYKDVYQFDAKGNPVPLFE